jgi:protein tyrosine/serine phosphatase
MKDNILYRSASPIDNSHNRAAVTDKLMKAAGVNYEVDLSDSDEELIEHMSKDDFNSPYFKTLYDKKNVIALDMNMQIKDNPTLQGSGMIKNEVSSTLLVKAQMKELTFGEKLVKGLKAMAEHDGPYLVHCVEGKDRTGYIVMVLSALSGASYQEMIDDYMITYDNYYGINKESDQTKYNTIKKRNIDMFLRYISDNEDNLDVDLTTINYEEAITKYLTRIGMQEKDINTLKTKLTK